MTGEEMIDISDVRASLIDRLKGISEKETGEFDIVTMPDFFFDHFVGAGSFNRFVEGIKEVHKRKGGNLLGLHQTFAQGGNAGNMATALSSLGFNVHFIGRTSKFGKKMIDMYLGSRGVDTSHVKSDGEMATTVALEFEGVNVMISYSGSNANFGFDSLEEKDLTLIEHCDLLSVSNWSQNKKGTDLARGAFTHARKFGAKTYFDTGDPTTRKKDIPELMEKVLKKGIVDIFGMNENELQQFSEKSCSGTKELLAAAQGLHKRCRCRIDFHTVDFAYSLGNGALISAFDIKPRRMTGAGDSWNAGNVFGELFGFTEPERLMFANAFAGAYIAYPRPKHPSLKQVIEFIQNKNLRKLKW